MNKFKISTYRNQYLYLILVCLFISSFQLNKPIIVKKKISAAQLLSDPKMKAMCYGGYRGNSREIQPSISELKDDIKIMHAMGIRILRTYNLQFPHASNVIKAIDVLKHENEDFEMYVMLGTWIDCKNAWTSMEPDHNDENEENNSSEIAKAGTLANAYPDIVKIIAVGNEAMVHWASSYFVQPRVILKYVRFLQELKKNGKLPEETWITSSDNFASWGGTPEYHNDDLKQLIEEVDYISLHTYPFHDTHYNPSFWHTPASDSALTPTEKVENAMDRAVEYARNQYNSVKNYVEELGIEKPIHIGETGWASVSRGFYGMKGSHAADEYKQALYYQKMREWTLENHITCFFFEMFDEPWKDANHPQGSENHFGLITVDGRAKKALWNMVDEGVFSDFTRNGVKIQKTYGGDEKSLWNHVLPPNELQ